MKTLIYMPLPGKLSGAPRRALTLARALRSNGFDACVVSEANSALLTCAKKHSFEAHPVNPTGALKLRQGSALKGGIVKKTWTALSIALQNFKLLKVILGSGADTVWIRGSKGIIYAGIAGFLSRKRIVWDIDYELPSQGIIRRIHEFGFLIAQVVIVQYKRAPVEIFGEDLAQKYSHKIIALIPGIEIDSLADYKVQHKARNEKHKETVFNILHIGMVCKRKNQRYLVNVAKKITSNAENNAFTLKLVGDVVEQDYAYNLNNDISELPPGSNVQFLGWRDDIYALLAQADLLVLPSEDEGVPNAIQEAMYIGVPVIASDVGGIPELIHHGETGWVLSLNDEEAWIEQIEKCIANPAMCQSVGANASAFAETHFGAKKWGDQYAKLLAKQPL